jgi:phenylpyruvate tautomerase PptA (4-oxalocrotonate tautomerase family)
MIEHLIGPVTGLLDKFVEDKDQKAKLAHEIATLAERQAHEIAKSQIEVNKAESQSGSVFIGGWRPATGWVCVLGFGVNFLVIPLTNLFLSITENPLLVPSLDVSEMMPVLLGMLGLGSMRTVEKTKNVAKQ